MLTNNWSLKAPKGLTAEIKGNLLYLYSVDHSKSVNINQEISSITNGVILNLSADIKCENVSPGVKSWNRARLMLLQLDKDGNVLSLPHNLASIIGTREWARNNNYFTIGPETKKILVEAQLSKSTGSLWIKNIRLYPVIQKEIYIWTKYIILAAWGVYFMFLVSTCLFNGNKNIFIRVMLVFAFIAIIVGISMPVDKKLLISDWVSTRIYTPVDVTGNDIAFNLTKVGHFCFFVLFGMVLFLLLNNKPDIIYIINILLLAGGTEIAQLYIGGRGPLFWDFIIDVNGGFFAFVIMKLYCLLRKED